jgi:MoaA/NifB/PqqE/SkfB family radical SAM enzyme
MIYSIDQVTHLHLEISSLCNAACPLCPRNFKGYPHNAGYNEHNMTLEEAKKIFPVNFIKQLNQMIINGNFGDAVMNPDTVSIVKYFKENNPGLHINISTNGGARDAKFWRGLAEAGAEVTFCIDGIDNYTHALYRRNTLYTVVMQNSAAFIAAGGHAIWKMIKFEHNSTVREEAQKISVQRGFKNFLLVNDGRDHGPVYNNNGDLTHVIGKSMMNWEPPARVESSLDISFNPIYKNRRVEWVKKENVKEIHCEVAQSKSVYVSSTGDVFPCCYMGFNPAGYRNNTDQGYSMEQISRIMSKNNALEYDLATCIKWFDQIEASWSKNSFEDGRLLTCNRSCGGSNLRPQFHVREAEMYHNTSVSGFQTPDRANE